MIAAEATARAEAPPKPLQCIERYYAAQALRTGDAWAAVLPDGTRAMYDDGRQKSPDERLARPDIQDMFYPRYTTGPIRPVIGPDEDPGRARVATLFYATYPESGLVRARFIQSNLKIHQKVVRALQQAGERLSALIKRSSRYAQYVSHLGGSFMRRTVEGTDQPSPHAYGIALDINVNKSHYWRWQSPKAAFRWQNRIPQEIVDIFESEGFIWGGRWYHYDTMHFEYRPELLDPTCYP
jgi:hypothetical protein